MSDPETTGSDTSDPETKGPNLVLIYSLIALSLIAAICFAMLIVLPFYHRR